MVWGLYSWWIFIFIHSFMSKIEKFEDIKAWQNSRELSKIIYNIFVDTQDWWFKNQICRASISIGNNIAEWFDRQSNKELRQFLYIAKWSCSEVRSMIYTWICDI